MLAVDETELPEGFLQDRGARQAEDDVFNLREKGLPVGAVGGKTVNLKLAANRVFHKLKEVSALLLDKGEEDLLGDLGARRPQRMQVGETRRVGDTEQVSLAVKEHGEIQRVAWLNLGLAQSRDFIAHTARHRPGGSVKQRLRRGIRPPRKL